MKNTKTTTSNLTFYSRLFLLILCLISLSGFTANCNISWTSTTVSVTTEFALSSYTLTSDLICGGGGGIGSSGIPSGNLVTINFPAGTNASTITSGTFNGSAISFILLNPTQITFNAPVNAAKGTSCTVILNDVTNPSAGTYLTLVLSAVNNSSGTTSFSNSNYTITPIPPMIYSSSTTTQLNTSNVVLGTIKNEVIGIEIVTTGTASPIDVTSFTFNTTGTTSPAVDILNAKLWYTGTSSTYATTTQVGATTAAPNGGFTIIGTQTLSVGTNYFWLSYEVPFTAISGNFIDAECTSITVNSVVQTPTTTVPVGNREIILQNTFFMTYDKGSNGGGSDIVQTTDGGYAKVLVDFSTGSFGGTDIYLHKIDAGGNTQWSKHFGGVGSDEAFSLLQTTDGGYFIAGASTSYPAAKWHIIKTDATGNVQWSDSYCNCGAGVITSIEQTTDGGYILFGYDGSDYYLVKIDNNGIEQWDNKYTLAGSDRGESVQQTTDGGYILGGIVDWVNPTTANITLIKTNSVGTTNWMKKYQIGASFDELLEIKQTPDGGYILAGHTNSVGAGNYDAFFIKTDATGNVEWSNTYGGASSDYAYGMDMTTDGGYVLTGYTSSFGNGSLDNWLLKVNSDGTVDWARAYGTAAADFGWRGIEQTADGGYILDGNSGNPVLIKTNEQGFIECNVVDVTSSITTTSFAPTVTDPSASYTIASAGAPDWVPGAEGEAVVVTTDNILCQQVVLPIELVSFTGKNKDNYNLLEWETSTEINNDFFTVERSIDAINFKPIGTISGAGNSNTILSYSFSDDNPYPLTYYRLKQTDFDGKFEYSKTISINNKELNQINVYPNPFNNNFTIQLPTDINYPINIEITDYLGRKIFSKLINGENQQVEVSLEKQLPTGAYFVKVYNDTESIVEKIMKMN